MARSTLRARPSLQIVLRGEARQLKQGLELSHIAYEILDQSDPMTMRVAVADWHRLRALAAERGYRWPDFICQSDAGGKGPFRVHWLRQEPAGTRAACGSRETSVLLLTLPATLYWLPYESLLKTK